LVTADQLRRTPPGGIGTYIRGLLQGFRALADEQAPADVARTRTPDDRPIIELVAGRAPGSRSAAVDPLSSLGYPLHSSRLPGRVLTKAWDYGIVRAPTGFDVIHATSLSTPEPGSSAMVVTVHDLLWRRIPDAFPSHGRAWHEAALRRAMNRADRFVVPAQITADELADAGAPSEAIAVIPMGSNHLPPPDLDEAASHLSRLGAEGPFLLSVGTLEPRKNQARLVEAYRQIRNALPEPWPLVLVGPSGWGEKLKPVAGVILAGPVSASELSALYAMARLLVYVPLVEGFGIPPVEAMTQGTPVVASPLPSTAGSALEVDPMDTDSIAQGILSAATDEGLRSRLQALGLQRSTELRWDRIAREHVAVWKLALESARRPVRG
jgi:glycosyltransferase involved in cell wall biosynthesis